MITLLGILAFGSLFAVAVFGIVSARKTEERREKNVAKSTLATDAPDTRQSA